MYHVPVSLLQAFVANRLQDREELPELLHLRPDHFCYPFSTRIVAEGLGQLVQSPPNVLHVVCDLVCVQSGEWTIIPLKKKSFGHVYSFISNV